MREHDFSVVEVGIQPSCQGLLLRIVRGQAIPHRPGVVFTELLLLLEDSDPFIVPLDAEESGHHVGSGLLLAQLESLELDCDLAKSGGRDLLCCFLFFHNFDGYL